MAKLLIFGSRTFRDRELAFDVLNATARRLIANGDRIVTVIHGCADGADTIGDHWAVKHGIPVQPFPAEWRKYGKRAGILRNQRMLEVGRPTHAVGFWLNGSRGTGDMLLRLQEAGVPVWMPEIRDQASGIRHQAADTRSPIPDP